MGRYAWELEKGGQELWGRVNGRRTNNCSAMIDAPVNGFCVAYAPEDIAAANIPAGALARVLDDGSPMLDDCSSTIQADARAFTLPRPWSAHGGIATGQAGGRPVTTNPSPRPGDPAIRCR